MGASGSGGTRADQGVPTLVSTRFAFVIPKRCQTKADLVISEAVQFWTVAAAAEAGAPASAGPAAGAAIGLKPEM